MLHTDTATFNRFLTSVGLLLLAAALVVPYFYFQSTDTLDIPASDLEGMTETGSAAIVDRQEGIVALEPWILALAALAALTGVALVVWGAVRLRAAQASDDEETELRKSRAKLEMRDMSADERAEKAGEEARREIAREEAGPARSESQESYVAALRERKREIARMSSLVSEAVREAKPRQHDLKLQVRIGTATESLALDGVFESTVDGGLDVVLRTRVGSQAGLARLGAESLVNEMIALLSRYHHLTRRVAKGWLVLAVIPEEGGSDFPLDGFVRQVHEIKRTLPPFGRLSVAGESELSRLPDDFSSYFEA